MPLIVLLKMWLCRRDMHIIRNSFPISDEKKIKDLSIIQSLNVADIIDVGLLSLTGSHTNATITFVTSGINLKFRG